MWGKLVRIISALVSLFVLMLAPGASAQETWQYRGVTFPARDGWCGSEGVDAGGVTSFVMKSCTGEWPQLSTAPMIPVGNPVAQRSIEEITSLLLQHADSPSERARVAEIGRRISPQCEMTDYSSNGNQLPGIRSVSVLAAFQCPQPVAYNNVTVMVRGRDGAIWGIAADFGGLAVTPEDIAQMRGMIDAIGQQ